MSRRSSWLRDGWLTRVGGNEEEIVRWGGQQVIESLVPVEIGRRDCIGRHLAVAEMRVFIAQLVGGGLRLRMRMREKRSQVGGQCGELL